MNTDLKRKSFPYILNSFQVGTLTTNGTFYIIESGLSGSNIFINSNGRSGTQKKRFGRTYLNSGFGSPSALKNLVYLKVIKPLLISS